MDLSPRAIFRILASVTLFLLLIWFIYAASQPLLWIAAAFLVALLLNPLVGIIQNYTPKKSRLAAILITVVLILAIFTFAILVMLSPLKKRIW